VPELIQGNNNIRQASWKPEKIQRHLIFGTPFYMGGWPFVLGLIKKSRRWITIGICDDPWVPANLSKRPLVRLSEVDVNKVHELIDTKMNCWRAKKLGKKLSKQMWQQFLESR
jgi:hypothetical protein